jgi:hypothetical protein
MTTTPQHSTGEQFAAAVRKSFQIGPRTRDRRDGGSLKADILESIANAVTYPGYYGPERTALSRAAWPTYLSYQKHVDGYRIPGELRFMITSMSPWQFTALIGEMIDAGVTNVGEGERFFADMAQRSA